MVLSSRWTEEASCDWNEVETNVQMVDLQSSSRIFSQTERRLFQINVMILFFATQRMFYSHFLPMNQFFSVLFTVILYPEHMQKLNSEHFHSKEIAEIFLVRHFDRKT